MVTAVTLLHELHNHNSLQCLKMQTDKEVGDNHHGDYHSAHSASILVAMTSPISIISCAGTIVQIMGVENAWMCLLIQAETQQAHEKGARGFQRMG